MSQLAPLVPSQYSADGQPAISQPSQQRIQNVPTLLQPTVIGGHMHRNFDSLQFSMQRQEPYQTFGQPMSQQTGGRKSGGPEDESNSGREKSKGRALGLATIPNPSDPKEMAYSYSFNQSIARWENFLLSLKEKEAHCSDLNEANKHSDEVYKELKSEFQDLEKDSSDLIFNSLQDNLSSNVHISQLKQVLEQDIIDCEHILSKLGDHFELKIGRHSDAKAFNLAVKSLPQKVSLTNFSCPSFYEFSLQFLNLLSGNPVNPQTYMPVLYDLLSDKNRTEMTSIKITENPLNHEDLFRIILTKHCTSYQTLSLLEYRQRQIGQLSVPVNQSQFRTELEKSRGHIQVINVALSWVKAILKFYPESDRFNIFLQGPYSSRFLQSLQSNYIPTEMVEAMAIFNIAEPWKQFDILCSMYYKNHSNLQEYLTSVASVEVTEQVTDYEDDYYDYATEQVTDYENDYYDYATERVADSENDSDDNEDENNDNDNNENDNDDNENDNDDNVDKYDDDYENQGEEYFMNV